MEETRKPRGPVSADAIARLDTRKHRLDLDLPPFRKPRHRLWTVTAATSPHTGRMALAI